MQYACLIAFQSAHQKTEDEKKPTEILTKKIKIVYN